MRKICFAGAYGIRSQGDDAALLSLVDGLRDRFGEIEVIVIVRPTGENAYIGYGLRTIENFEYEQKSQSIDKWFRGFNYGDDQTHLRKLQDTIAESDLLVLGAGNFLLDESIDLLRGPIPYFTILSLMAKMVGTPIMLYGVSAGPLYTTYGRRLARLIAALADVVTLRDQQSLEVLHSAGYNGNAIVLPDPVLGLNPMGSEIASTVESWRKAHNDQRPVFAVSVRYLPGSCHKSNAEYINIMAQLGDALIERYNYRPLFIPQCTYTHGEPHEDDRHTARRIVGLMAHNARAILVEEDLSVPQCLAMYHGAHVAVCTRLHANVYAAIQQVPTIAIAYNPKVSSFMEWLGLTGLIVSMTDLSCSYVLEKVQYASSKRRNLSKAISQRVIEGRMATVQYADLAQQLILNSSRTDRAGTFGEHAQDA